MRSYFSTFLWIFLLSIVPAKGTSLPLQITADHLLIQHPLKKALFTGKVVVTYENMTLYAPALTVYYKEKGQIDHIDVTGPLSLHTPEGVLYGNKGSYFAEKTLVVVTEHVKLIQKESTLTGHRATYHLKKHVFEMESQEDTQVKGLFFIPTSP